MIIPKGSGLLCCVVPGCRSRLAIASSSESRSTRCVSPVRGRPSQRIASLPPVWAPVYGPPSSTLAKEQPGSKASGSQRLHWITSSAPAGAGTAGLAAAPVEQFGVQAGPGRRPASLQLFR